MFFRQKHSTRSDQELVDAFRETGDLVHLSELFTRYTSLMHGVCLKYLRDREEAKDAVMQLFEKLSETLRSHEVTNFKSWLYVSTKNHCLMKIRSKKGKLSQQWDDRDMENALVLHPVDENDLEVNLVAMGKCLEELVLEQKRCVELFFLEQKSYKEVSEATGFELNAVKSYLQNGKRNLTLCMERNGRQ